MPTLQDRFIGIKEIIKKFSYIDDDKSTKICAFDIAEFFDHWYPELFVSIADDSKAYAKFKTRLYSMNYFSFAEISEDYLADYNTMATYDFFTVLANNHGYDNIEDMEVDYIVICDVEIDGAIVIG